MHVVLRPGVVLLAAFALVLVSAGAFMAGLNGASAAGGGPEMRLTAVPPTARSRPARVSRWQSTSLPHLSTAMSSRSPSSTMVMI